MTLDVLVGTCYVTSAWRISLDVHLYRMSWLSGELLKIWLFRPPPLKIVLVALCVIL